MLNRIAVSLVNASVRVTSSDVYNVVLLLTDVTEHVIPHSTSRLVLSVKFMISVVRPTLMSGSNVRSPSSVAHSIKLTSDHGAL